jgi:hypothetical protein
MRGDVGERVTFVEQARRSAKTVVGIAQQVDPSRLVLVGAPPPGASIGVVAIYRAAHAARLARLVTTISDAGATVRLWALDEIADGLRALTVGRGPGIRFALLNQLIESIPEADRRDGLVLSDDDYSFRVGDLRQLIAVGQALNLDVWQPAHVRDSWASSPFVRRRGGVVLRRTNFVEQGPVLVLSARAQRAMLPLPEDLGMGWGIEVQWAQIYREASLNVGVLDALAVHHLAPIGGYDRDAQGEQLRSLLQGAGFDTIADLQTEYSRVKLFEGRSLMHAG